MNNQGRIEAIYEQCPWNREHVESLHPILSGKIIVDGNWHDISTEDKRVSYYRVFSCKYFQAVYAKEKNKIFDRIFSLEPIESDDDSEWAIWQLDSSDEESGYGLTSRESVCFGPFDHHNELLDWLPRHALSIEPYNFHIMGVAYFTDIERGCLLDAIERLAWLEDLFAQLMSHYRQFDFQFWQRIKMESDLLMSKIGNDAVPEEIVPPPGVSVKRKPKWRTPA
jgi:hypothetical protein